jgi:antirestriction protein ArdC
MEDKTMKAEQARRLTEEHLHRLAQALEAGHSQTLRDYLAVMARFPRYSFRNQLLIASQRPDATRVAGFQAWRQLGRWVKRGEKGIAIVAPLPLRRAEPADGDDGDVLLAFKAVHVFDVSQTDGEPLPELAATQGDPADHLVRLKAVITDRGIRLRYCEDLDGADGASGGGLILVRSALTAGEEFAVLAHEFAHELLHRGERRTGVPRKVRELEAEAVAYVVSEAIGLDTNTACADYIHLYQGDTDTLTESLYAIRQTASIILEALLPEARDALAA